MNWSKWRWIRLVALALVVVSLGQKFLSENNVLIIPGLKQSLKLSSQSDSEECASTSDLELGTVDIATIPTPKSGLLATDAPAPTDSAPTDSVPADFAPTTSVSADSALPVSVPKQAESTEVTYIKENPANFPYISDTDVIVALNTYRASHKVHQLVEHPSLCQYAEKRVGDLVDFGGLDHHEGFKEDFAGEEIPQALQSYPGTTIGENLAYQHCINMQTQESFIANSAAALIEWCFDSSTAGHREAQLNPKFNNVCIRHKNGLFVVIFGD